MAVPKNPDDVRQFVGFAGFYRRFIKDFSKIVKPLQDIMPPQNQRKKRVKTEIKGWEWRPEHECGIQQTEVPHDACTNIGICRL